MNKKIILSLSIIGIAAAIAIGGTVAYFSDTETSTGNILVAGSLDLKVDHTKQTYNDIDCKTCSVDIKSDITNLVTGTVDGNDSVPFPHNAVPVTATWVTDAYWTNAIPGATWIWATDPVMQQDSDNTVTYTFEKDFIWYGPVTGASMSLGVAADNNYTIYLNDNLVAADNSGGNSASVDNIPSANIAPHIFQGSNILRIDVTNLAQSQLPPINNPGGLLYALTINGNCEDNYFKQNCRLWGEKDLVAGDTFFNFVDVKPGDSGTNVISLHVYNNDAWVCMSTENVLNNENGLTEPELSMTPPDDDTTGELGENINIFMWRDADFDGVYDAGESLIGSYALKVDSIIPLYDSVTLGGSPLVGDTDTYVGLAWCAGTQTVVGNTIFCDGSVMDNYSQSDKVTADLILRSEQSRNQDGFTCQAE